MAKKQVRRPTTVPSESAVRNPKSRGSKSGFIDLPDADDIWNTINFWSGRGDATLPEEVVAARDATKTIVGTGAQALDAYYTGGLGGSFYNNVLRPQTDINSRTNANWGRFSRDVAIAGGTAAATAAVVKGAQIAAESPVLQHYGNRMLNALKGEQVVIHSGRNRGLTQLNPTGNPHNVTDLPRVFAWDAAPVSYRAGVNNPGLVRGMPEDPVSRGIPYAVPGLRDHDATNSLRAFWAESPSGWVPRNSNWDIGGSFYVAKVPKKGLGYSTETAKFGLTPDKAELFKMPRGSVASPYPGRVVSEMPVPPQVIQEYQTRSAGFDRPFRDAFRNQVREQVYRAGGTYNSELYGRVHTPVDNAQFLADQTRQRTSKVVRDIRQKLLKGKKPMVDDVGDLPY